MSNLSSIRLFNESKRDLEEQASKIEDSTGILTNFFAIYFILLKTLTEVAMTRSIENLVVSNEEKDIY